MYADYTYNNSLNAVDLFFGLEKGDKVLNKLSKQIYEVADNPRKIEKNEKSLILNNCFFEVNRKRLLKSKSGIESIFLFSHYNHIEYSEKYQKLNIGDILNKP